MALLRFCLNCRLPIKRVPVNEGSTSHIWVHHATLYEVLRKGCKKAVTDRIRLT